MAGTYPILTLVVIVLADRVTAGYREGLIGFHGFVPECYPKNFVSFLGSMCSFLFECALGHSVCFVKGSSPC